MIDFMAQFDSVSNSEAGATLHFKTPTGDLAYIGEDKPMTVTMQGASGSLHKKHAAGLVRKMRAEAKQKHGKKKEEEITEAFFDELAESQVERLIAVVTAWENVCENGEPIECTKENIKRIFTQYQVLRVQAIDFLDADVNFIKA